MKFHHVAIIVSDKERALRFYQDILGFTLERVTYREERDSYKIDLKKNEMRLELFTFPGAPVRPSRPEALGLRHLAFERNDVESFHEELKKQGLDVEEIRVDEFTGKKFFFFPDPDNLPLEIYEAN
jgi:glyoxylase I family protein